MNICHYYVTFASSSCGVECLRRQRAACLGSEFIALVMMVQQPESTALNGLDNMSWVLA